MRHPKGAYASHFGSSLSSKQSHGESVPRGRVPFCSHFRCPAAFVLRPWRAMSAMLQSQKAAPLAERALALAGPSRCQLFWGVAAAPSLVQPWRATSRTLQPLLAAPLVGRAMAHDPRTRAVRWRSLGCLPTADGNGGLLRSVRRTPSGPAGAKTSSLVTRRRQFVRSS